MSVPEAAWLPHEINAIALATSVEGAGDIDLVRLVQVDNVDVIPSIDGGMCGLMFTWSPNLRK